MTISKIKIKTKTKILEKISEGFSLSIIFELIVVQTKAILFLKSMSERGGSDIVT